jgi:hypothetical protein
MPWHVYLAPFVAGAFAAIGIPHTVQGICGNRLQTAFASPPAIGESSALGNVIWGMVNFAISGGLLHYFLPREFPPPLVALYRRRPRRKSLRRSHSRRTFQRCGMRHRSRVERAETGVLTRRSACTE